ncbi:acetylcholine receptor subunit beta-type unc-29-like [Mizuhopecten yessoensis]|uniref:Acetylcholine receptor subunit beta-type unc-29 n=1 Tax=Mizuhopecten yessoensis TaxID=6573 RepID=A0A210Q9I4_MIZYE|nr:acetylcholine receptor subunit beta-type unc-29-like [Mizuhopecten yessoensis]OWF45407.1 Acetylcholine receptor subunit beta-type unc-29 [Mizuhopecten yessoensis]
MADSNILALYIWILMGSLTTIVSSRNIWDRTRLHKSLIDQGYDTTVYPGSTDSPLQVSIQFSLAAFNDFDENAGRFAVTGFLIVEWRDERIAWDPNDFGQISSILFPQSRVWIPNIVVWNTYDRVRPFGFDTLPVRYNHSGDALWEPGNLFQTSCDAQIKKFPFDEQTCTIDILPYGYMEDEINITAAGFDLSDYNKNGLWNIISTDISGVQRNSRAEKKLMIEIKFNRRSSYHVIHILVPMLVMSILNILIFIIPVDGSNRIDYAVTMLLTLSVFLTVVTDTLPSASLPDISYLSVLVLVQMMSSSLMVACAVVSLCLGSHSTLCLQIMTSVLKPFMCFVTVPESGKPQLPNPDSKLESPDSGNDNDSNRNEHLMETQFKSISKLFDYLCIFFFLLEVIIANLVFFVATNIP